MLVLVDRQTAKYYRQRSDWLLGELECQGRIHLMQGIMGQLEFSFWCLLSRMQLAIFRGIHVFQGNSPLKFTQKFTPEIHPEIPPGNPSGNPPRNPLSNLLNQKFTFCICIILYFCSFFASLVFLSNIEIPLNRWLPFQHNGLLFDLR